LVTWISIPTTTLSCTYPGTGSTILLVSCHFANVCQDARARWCGLVRLVLAVGTSIRITVRSGTGTGSHPPAASVSFFAISIIVCTFTQKDGRPLLSAKNLPPRSAMLQALRRTSPAEPLDVLVIGGGATGTGVALDAATRYAKQRAGLEQDAIVHDMCPTWVRMHASYNAPATTAKLPSYVCL
jgi:hypothetical protein